MQIQNVNRAKRIVGLTAEEVEDACRLWLKMKNVQVPDEAGLFVIGSYNKATGLQFEWALTP